MSCGAIPTTVPPSGTRSGRPASPTVWRRSASTPSTSCAIDAGLIFKGYEYDGAEDPFEAGIGFVVTKNKEDDFVGKKALARRRRASHPDARRTRGRGPRCRRRRRRSSPAARPVGVVTSGTFSPVLEKNLALARVQIGHAGLGGRLEVAERPARTRRPPAPPSSAFPSTTPTRPVPGRRPWQRAVPADRRNRSIDGRDESLSVVALGAGRLVQRWPGLLAVPVSYGIAAAALYGTRSATSCRR